MMLALYFVAYLPMAIMSIVIDISSKLLLNWIVAAFADQAGNLPRCLSWFGTFDNDLDAGMRARQQEIAAGTGKEWAAFDPAPKTWFARYRNRALWLFRNTGYGFDYCLLGMRWDPAEWRVVHYSGTDTSTVFFAVGRGFYLYAQGRYGTAKLGWKAWNRFDPHNGQFDIPWGDGTRAPIAFTINPFK